MNKTAQTELHRLFLVEGLPEPLTPASRHLQIFDNYLPNTRIRLRKVRDPATNAWTKVLQQRFPAVEGEYAVTKLSEIYLNESEYAVFEIFEGRELRKNRYFHEFDGVSITFDVYLGDLLGLSTARVDFDSIDRMKAFETPAFAIFEITNAPFFLGENLIDKGIADVESEVLRLGSLIQPPVEIPTE